jgi:hypothetical protein
MADEDKPDKNDIKKGAAVSGIGTILPYAVLAGAGLYLYKKYGEDVQDAFSGAVGAAGGITETISNITETVSNTTKSVTTFIEDNTISEDEATDIEQEGAAFAAGSAPGVKLPKLTGEQEKFISKYSDDKKKVRNFRETPYLNLGLGPDTTPLKRSMLGLDDKTLVKAMSHRSKKVQSAQQAEGLSPMAARGAKPDIRTPEQKKDSKPNKKSSSSSSNRGGLKIVKNKHGMTNKEAQKQGLSPAAWRGI